MDRQQEFVLRTIEERDIRFIRLWFTDVVGTLKSVALAPAEVESAFDEGLGFDGSSIEGFSRIYESDMLLQPDPSTFQILPWRGEEDYTSRMFCDVLTPDGEISASDTRGVLKRVLNKAAEMGFTCYTSPEIEFYLLESSKLGADGFPVPVDHESYFDHTPGGIVQDFRRKAVTMLEEVGISVEFSHHETGPGQNEIDLRHADALQTADNVMTFRTVIKEVAYSLGMYATFMPKPFTKYAGSGMHTHFSLFEGDTNAFFEAGAEYQLSKTARHFIAGVLKHAPEFTAVTNQFINSYKRLLGPQQPLRPRACAPVQAEQDAVRPHRVPRPGLGVEPVPRLRGDSRRRPEGHRKRVPAHARRDRRPRRHDQRRTPSHGLQPAARIPA